MGLLEVPTAVVTVIAFFHIVSAMGWLGGGILFVSTLAPGIRRMSPAASVEFFAVVVPSLTRYFLVVVMSTVTFGPLLFLTIPDESPLIYGGMATGLTAFLIVISEVPTFGKLSRMAQEMMKNGIHGPPSPEYLKGLKRVGRSTLVTIILLLATLVFMVYSGYPF